MHSYQNTLTVMEGLLPYARGFFYHLPLTTAQINTWHPHIYDKPAKTPTPFYISNILDLSKDSRTDENQCSAVPTSGNDAGSLYSKDLLNASRILNGTSRFHGVVRTGNVELRGEKEDDFPVAQRGTQSPCPYLRDRVESPQEGRLNQTLDN